MLLLLFVLGLIVISSLIITALFWSILGKCFRIENLTFKKVLLTCVLLAIIGIVFQLILLGLTFLKVNNILFNLIISIASLIIAIWIIKRKFNTTSFKSIGLYLSTIVLAISIALIIRTYIVQAFKLPSGSGSMKQSLLAGDCILANKILFKFTHPKRGDIIVFRYPKNQSKDFIMRIIAVGGEKIEIVNKQVFINGKLIDEPYAWHEDDHNI
jgi:signal peptidase I